MQKDIYERIISFLLGASWAIVLFGALITFKTFIFLGFGLSLFITIFFVFITLFMILTLDAFSINRKRLEEAKKQTDLLEKISSENKQSL
jgi:membrane protein implicated in regulation of membrane protease activity